MLVTALAAVGVAIIFGGAAASASSPKLRVGSAAKLPPGARVGNALPSSTRLHLTVALQPQDAAGLAAFATAVSTPGSAQFRQYLTVSDFAQRFGATQSQLSTVENALRAQGMSVGTPTANGLTIPVTGTTAQVEKAFAVTESQVTLPGGRVAYANDQAPVMQASVAQNVQGVIGLDDVAREQPQGLTRRRGSSAAQLRRAHTSPSSQAIGSGPAPCSTASAQGGYTADLVASMYGLGTYYPSNEGAGQTVALVEFGPYAPTDVAAYQACYTTAASVSNVNVDGGPSAYVAGQSDDGEAMLDVDQVIGLAPKASILMYQAPDNGTQADVLTAIASQNIAKVTSSSWGECESLTPQAVINSENTTLQEMAAQGQSFFISSGDSGSTMCYQATRTAASPNYGLSVIDPGGQPFATGVGGTFLGTQSGGLPDNGTYPGESVWNDGLNNGAPGDQASGTGGGVSDQWPMPGYQSSAAGILNVIQSASSRTCGAQFCRQVPDVSADADPNSGYDVYSNGGWGVTGGTSAAAPLWAAFTALANASATCRGLTLGFENPALYAIAGSAYAANFHDITQPNPATAQANNDTFYQYNNPQNPSDDYPVQAGYDMATGLGSPVGNVLGPSLCSARSPVYAVTLASPGNQLTIKGHAVSLGVAGTDSGGAGLTYAAAGLPAGLAMSPTGVISGTPTTNQSTTVTVSATDGYTNTGSTQFTWSVVTPTAPRVSSTKLSGLGKRKPKLTLSVIAGQFAPALKSVSIKLPGGLGFAKKAKTLAKGISVKSGGRKVKFSAKASHGVLTISLKTAVTSASVTLSSPAITITAGEASKVHRHKVKKLKVTVKATDASNHSTGFAITLKKLK